MLRRASKRTHCFHIEGLKFLMGIGRCWARRIFLRSNPAGRPEPHLYSSTTIKAERERERERET